MTNVVYVRDKKKSEYRATVLLGAYRADKVNYRTQRPARRLDIKKKRRAAEKHPTLKPLKAVRLRIGAEAQHGLLALPFNCRRIGANVQALDEFQAPAGNTDFAFFADLKGAPVNHRCAFWRARNAIEDEGSGIYRGRWLGCRGEFGM